MNSDKAAAVRDSINGCPTVIDEEAVRDRDGKDQYKRQYPKLEETVVGSYTHPRGYTYRPPYVEQSGEVGNGKGARRPVFVVVLAATVRGERRFELPDSRAVGDHPVPQHVANGLPFGLAEFRV